ncbi:MAG: thioredoxin family protein [Calditrichaeota bacterium]|nr:thioredoxin family protein [Calditrichota bacterium]MCB0315750.1 thioredoxin family protein [Calditrichota bacterium]MCB9088463.1 thioredoxin family protein [Calditrichia bacterium]
MTFIHDQDRINIEKRFQDLDQPVRILNFSQEMECNYCKETRQLLEELAALSDKITLEVYDLIKDQAVAEQFGIDKLPATVVMGEKDYGIRLYGIPSGFEFSTLLEDILLVSRRDSRLSPETRQQLAEVTEPTRIQVFVTPTCPYCPRAVVLAHQFAMENDLITADMVEVTEFPHLAQRYGVRGVPKTVANEVSVAEGALPETHLLNNLLAVTTH